MSNVVPPPFSSDRIDRLVAIERHHFWFVGRRRLVERLIAEFGADMPNVLDVGVGGGLQAGRLSDAGRGVTAIDFLPDGLRHIGSTHPSIRRVQCTAEAMPFADGAFDLILALDVVEHTDDRSAIAEFVRVLKPGGTLIVTVPAFAFLWSIRDELAGHRRRYRAGDIRQRLSDVGLEVRRLGYYQCLLFPFVLLTRILGRNRKAVRDAEDLPSTALNSLFRTVNELEIVIGRWVHWPFGSSVFAVARKGGARVDA